MSFILDYLVSTAGIVIQLFGCDAHFLNERIPLPTFLTATVTLTTGSVYLLLCLSVLAAATTYHLGRRGMRKQLFQPFGIELEPFPHLPPLHLPPLHSSTERVSEGVCIWMIYTRAGWPVLRRKLALPGYIQVDQISRLTVRRA